MSGIVIDGHTCGVRINLAGGDRYALILTEIDGLGSRSIPLQRDDIAAVINELQLMLRAIDNRTAKVCPACGRSEGGVGAAQALEQLRLRGDNELGKQQAGSPSLVDGRR